MLDGAGDLAGLSKVQQRILTETIQPDAAAGVAISDAHRDEPHMRRPARCGVERGGDDFADDAHGDRAKRIATAVLTYEDDLGAATPA